MSWQLNFMWKLRQKFSPLNSDVSKPKQHLTTLSHIICWNMVSNFGEAPCAWGFWTESIPSLDHLSSFLLFIDYMYIRIGQYLVRAVNPRWGNWSEIWKEVIFENFMLMLPYIKLEGIAQSWRGISCLTVTARLWGLAGLFALCPYQHSSFYIMQEIWALSSPFFKQMQCKPLYSSM